MGNTAERYDEAYFQGLRPDPVLLVSQWADQQTFATDCVPFSMDGVMKF
ncbi:MAG: hypothetical protein HQL73_09615 [Magnetococcales bacterium]|nr:hypothetical protein [Magnetococcales bacterium]